MADHFYGVNLGDEMPAEVSTGTSTTSKKIELRIEDGNSLSKTDVIKALDSLKAYIARDNAPA